MSSFARERHADQSCNLIVDGLLKEADCESDFPRDVVDYEAVIPFKIHLLETAWKNFQAGERKDLRPAYEEFCAQQEHWLEDYALFRALKAKYHGSYYLSAGRPGSSAIHGLSVKCAGELANQVDEARFAQFLLFRQGDQLKRYAHSKGVSIIGDLPFFVSHWVKGHHELWVCDQEGAQSANTH